MKLKYFEKSIYRGYPYGVLTNLTKQPNVLVVGPIGARDLLLFPFSHGNLKMYSKLKKKKPEFTSFSGQRYIINEAIGGGAAHYIIEQLPYYAPEDCTIGLFSLVGDNPMLPNIVENLEKLKIQYYILHFYNMPYTRFAGIVFPSGDRYWSRRLHYYASMELFDPSLIPKEFTKSDIVIIATLPPNITQAFSMKCEGTLVGQIFEHYFTEENHQSLNKLICDVWPKRCALINMNETELTLLEELLSSSTNNSAGTPSQKLKNTTKILSKSMSEITLLIGVGEKGMFAYNKTKSQDRYFYFPAVSSSWEFCLGAGDTALASAIGTMLKILVKKQFSYKEIRSALNSFVWDDWFDICKSFTEGGFVGISIIDASTPLKHREELIELSKEKVRNLTMVEDRSCSHMNRVKIPSLSEIKSRIQEGYVNQEIEEVLDRAFGHKKINA